MPVNPCNAIPQGVDSGTGAAGTSALYSRCDHKHVLASLGVATAKIADLAITNAKIANGTIDLTTKATYVPVNKAGDAMSGNLEFNINTGIRGKDALGTYHNLIRMSSDGADIGAVDLDKIFLTTGLGGPNYKQWWLNYDGRTYFPNEILPDLSGAYNLGSSSYKWKNLNLAGDIFLDAGKLVDGVDISAHAANANAHHSSLSAGLNITPASVSVSGSADIAGNVGIGTASPGSTMGSYNVHTKLDVVSSSTQAWLRLASGVTGEDVTGIWLHPFDFTNAGWMVGTNNAGKLRLGYGGGVDEGAAVTNAKDGSSGITIQTDGNVGIGTASPGAKLEVVGQIKITGSSPGAGKVLTSDATGLATWETTAGGAHTLDSHQLETGDYNKLTESLVVGTSPTLKPRITLDCGGNRTYDSSGIDGQAVDAAIVVSNYDSSSNPPSASYIWDAFCASKIRTSQIGRKHAFHAPNFWHNATKNEGVNEAGIFIGDIHTSTGADLWGIHTECHGDSTVDTKLVGGQFDIFKNKAGGTSTYVALACGNQASIANSDKTEAIRVTGFNEIGINLGLAWSNKNDMQLIRLAQGTGWNTWIEVASYDGYSGNTIQFRPRSVGYTNCFEVTDQAIRVPVAVTPASLRNGMIWYDGTNFKCRKGGVTQTINTS